MGAASRCRHQHWTGCTDQGACRALAPGSHLVGVLGGPEKLRHAYRSRVDLGNCSSHRSRTVVRSRRASGGWREHGQFHECFRRASTRAPPHGRGRTHWPMVFPLRRARTGMLSRLCVCGLGIGQARRRLAATARLPTLDDLAADHRVSGVLSRADEDRPLLVARVLSHHLSSRAGAHRC